MTVAVAVAAPAADSPLIDSGAHPDTAPLLDVEAVTLQYKTAQYLVTATWRVSFKVYQGDRFVLLGPSGCGKSTILKAIGGFVRPVEGSIRLNGRLVREPGPDRMMVFQEFDQLLPWKTVRLNVMFPLRTARGMARTEAGTQADVTSTWRGASWGRSCRRAHSPRRHP